MNCTLRGRPWRLALLAVALVAAAGCRRGAVEQPGAPPSEAGGQTVSLLVLQGPGGSTLALVPVFIGGQGPFAFALDTGASHSVIDKDLAEQLDLPATGPAVEMTGVVTTTEAHQVRVGTWRVGDVELPGRTLVALTLSEPDRRVKLRGLLGSDVLSRFGAVTVDYDNRRLTLRSRP